MESTPPETPNSPTDADAVFTPVVVSQCSTLNEAQIVVGLLASFGIAANIDSENYYRMLGSMVPGVEGIRVLVRQLDAEAALDILDAGSEPAEIEKQK